MTLTDHSAYSGVDSTIGNQLLKMNNPFWTKELPDLVDERIGILVKTTGGVGNSYCYITLVQQAKNASKNDRALLTIYSYSHAGALAVHYWAVRIFILKTADIQLLVSPGKDTVETENLHGLIQMLPSNSLEIIQSYLNTDKVSTLDLIPY